MKEELEKLSMGFIKHHDFELLEVSPKRVILKAPLTEKSMNPYDMAHGGLIFGLGDTAMGILCRTTNRNAVTVNASINYLKPGKGEYLTAESEMLKEGNKLCFLRANIYDSEHNLIANMEGTYYFIN